MLRSLVRCFGYDLQKTSDPFQDQRRLLSGVAVRTVFDVGANVGAVTRALHECFPESMIHSFEPFPESFESLCAKFRGEPWFKPVRAAVSDRSGRQTLYVNRKSTSNSLLPAATGAEDWVSPRKIANVTTARVEVTTIDEYCRQEAIDEIHVLKMDIQGGEMTALRGAAEMLSRKAVSLIYTEALFVPLYQGQPSFHELCAFLTDHGYALFNLYDLHHARGMRQVLWGNALFVNEPIRHSAIDSARNGP